ncbi:MAG: hypothetical protein ACLGQH_02725, partial [Acidobacteriota bacterium]
MATPIEALPGSIAGASGRSGAAAYWCVGLAVTVLLYGQFVLTDRVGILDWSKDLYYFALLYDSLRSFGQLPLSFLVIPPQIDWFSTLQDLSYWSNPEVISLSPLLPLAFVLPFMAFVKAYFGLHLLAGIWGIRFLARRLGFDLVQALTLLVLFLGNPWLVQHLAIGYSPQISLCLLPAMAACLARPVWRPLDLAGACLLAATVFYQGALHLFVWTTLAVGCFAVLLAVIRRQPAVLWRVGAFFAGSLILVAPKAYAVQAVYGSWRRVPGSGYASLADLWGLITDDVFPLFQFPETYSHCHVAFYDGSILMGPVFVALCLGLVTEYVVRLARGGGRQVRKNATTLAALLAALVFCILGWGTVWGRVCALLTPLASEIYPFRFLFITLNFLFFFIVSRLGPWPGPGPGRWRALAILACMAAVCATLYARNRTLMPVLTEQPNFIGHFSLADYYAERITAVSEGVRLPTAASPAGVVITPPGCVGERIELPWLPQAALGGYGIDNARPVSDPAAAEQASTVLEVTAASRPVALRARDYGRAWLLPTAGLIL